MPVYQVRRKRVWTAVLDRIRGGYSFSAWPGLYSDRPLVVPLAGWSMGWTSDALEEINYYIDQLDGLPDHFVGRAKRISP